jgi:hypothetical protein
MAKTTTETPGARNGAQAALRLEQSAALMNVEPLLTASNKWLENMLALSNEMFEFGRSRLDRNIEMSKAIARSGSFDEAIELQADFTRTLVNDYVSEATKLADLSTRVVMESFSAWQSSTRSLSSPQGSV